MAWHNETRRHREAGRKGASERVSDRAEEARAKITDSQRKRADLLKRNAENANDDAARELEMFTQNDYDIYRQRIVPIEKNLQKKWDKGTYDPDMAALLWKNAADDAAKKYDKEFGTPGRSSFTVADRAKVAQELEEYWREELKSGNRVN